MAVFTLFAYGTWEHHETKGKHEPTNNFISKFASASTDVSNKNGMILDGPGTLGLEVKPNAKRAVAEIIDWLKRQDDSKNKVNITGFSRGSVTSIYIANYLKRKQDELEKISAFVLSVEDKKLLAKLKNLELNMFLVDPVAGMSDKGKPFARIIPDNVKNYVAVLQLDERRRDFKPQDLSRAIVINPNKTKVTMLPLYGNHSDTTKIKSKKMESGVKILWHSVHQFLSANGSSFNNDQVPDYAFSDDYPIEDRVVREDLPEDPQAQRQHILDLFSQHHQERSAYRESGMKAKLADGILTPRTDRSMNQHLRFYVKHSFIFINQLERELFKVTYPATFNYLFEMNQPDPRFAVELWSKASVIQELAEVKEKNPGLFNRLKAYQLVEEKAEMINVGEPSGYYHQVSLSTIQQIYPNLVPDSSKVKRIDEIEKLSATELEIYRTTFRYQREKNNLNFAGQRCQSANAIKIRSDIHEIVNLDQRNSADKYQLVLDKLEEHYKHLILSANDSDLTWMTGNILARHGRIFEIKQSLGNEILVEFLSSIFSLVKYSVQFIGTFGFIGGSFLFAVGNALDSIGERIMELIGDVGSNPFKLLGFIAGALILGIGLIIKNGFGLRPINNFIVQGIKECRDWTIGAINTSTFDRINASAKEKNNLISNVESNENSNPTTVYKNELKNLSDSESDSDSYGLF